MYVRSTGNILMDYNVRPHRARYVHKYLVDLTIQEIRSNFNPHLGLHWRIGGCSQARIKVCTAYGVCLPFGCPTTSDCQSGKLMPRSHNS